MAEKQLTPEIRFDKRHTLDAQVKAGEIFDILSAARVLGVGPNYLRHLCRKKRIHSFKVLGKIYLTKNDLSTAVRPMGA